MNARNNRRNPSGKKALYSNRGKGEEGELSKKKMPRRET